MRALRRSLLHASLKTRDRIRRDKERRKARMIQSAVRRNFAMAYFQQHRGAATKVANFARVRAAKLERTRRNDNRRRHFAATSLASAHRRKTAQKDWVKNKQAAVKLQTRARTKFATSMLQEAKGAATVLQTSARRKTAMRLWARQKVAAARIRRTLLAHRASADLAFLLNEAHGLARKVGCLV